MRGIYVMGKAATLNGRVGDVMISSVVHDEHSLNTYLCATALCPETCSRIWNTERCSTTRKP